ncbi:MAG: hypothetical protein ACKN86_03770, partial [Crocinitomicaceae bacterium]
LDKAKMAVRYFDASAAQFLAQINSADEDVNKAKGMLMSTDTSNIKQTIINKFKGYNYLEASVDKSNMNGQIMQQLGLLVQDFEYPEYMEFVDQYGYATPPEKLRDWSSVDLSEAMEFVRNDANALENGSKALAFFPSKKFSLKVNKQNALATGTINANQLAACPDRINFAYDRDRYLTKSEIMMLDVLANNDWKRGIYFSSNRGSNLSIALLQSGYIKQVGVAFELSPIRGEFNKYTRMPSLIDADKMYKNLTEVYSYGDLKNPDVLTDYYARRHTTQYRQCFLQLAEEFYFRGKRAEDSLNAVTKVSATIKPATEAQKQAWRKQVADNFAKTEKLLDMAMEVIPFETVLDFGEVGAIDPLGSLSLNSEHSHYDPERKVQAYASGHLHEYVQLYTLIKKFDKASALATKILGSYETIFGFFQNSDPSLAANPENAEDLHAALDACFKIQSTAQNAGHTKLAKEAESKIEYVYKNITKSIVDALSGSEEGNALERRLQLMRNHYWVEEKQNLKLGK